MAEKSTRVPAFPQIEIYRRRISIIPELRIKGIGGDISLLCSRGFFLSRAGASRLPTQLGQLAALRLRIHQIRTLCPPKSADFFVQRKPELRVQSPNRCFAHKRRKIFHVLTRLVRGKNFPRERDEKLFRVFRHLEMSNTKRIPLGEFAV